MRLIIPLIQRVILIFMGFSLLISCIESNTLLGQWEEKQSLFSQKKASEKGVLQFYSDRIILDGRTIFVDYKFKDDNTVLLFSDGYMSKIEFVAENEIILIMPRGTPRQYIKTSKKIE